MIFLVSDFIHEESVTVWHSFYFIVPEIYRLTCFGELTYIRRGVSHGCDKLNPTKSDVVGEADEIGQDLAQLFVTVGAIIFEKYTR